MNLPIPKELDITEIWTNRIDKEVLRGIKVRDEKFKAQQSNSIYKLVDIDFDKPSCSKSYGSQINRALRSKKNENYHRSISPQRIKRYRKLKKNNNYGRNRCGMRIAELAVPSKRHCIDTWRSKWDTLPTLMLDRLRRIVMDQKPIVPIHDAINCFKQKKSKHSRSPNKGNKTLKSKKNKNIEMLCAIFAFRISAKLQAPRNVTLGSSLIPISQIVSDEISRLLGKRRTTSFQLNIHQEITNKISNWIADILEQSNHNLMLEDYIELEKEEGHIWDIIDELVDNIVILCKDPSNSSSEVMDTESSNLNPSFVKEDSNIYPESEYSNDNNSVDFENMITNIQEKTTSNDINTQDKDTTSQENLNNLNPKTSSESLENYIKSFLSKYIEEINKTTNDEDQFEDAIYFKPSDSWINKTNDEVHNTTPHTIDENNKQIKIYNEADINFNEDIDNIENALKDDFENETMKENNSMDNKRNSIDIIKPNIASENIRKEVSVNMSNSEIKEITSVPEDNENMIEDSTNHKTDYTNNIEYKNDEIDEIMPLKDVGSDESIKKVKFSNMDSEQGELNTKSNSRSWDNKKSRNQNIHFAPPNDHLLSDADESWPENLRFPTVKATVSISKSVLSLGKINEIEEKKNDPSSVNEDVIIANDSNIDEELVHENIEKAMALLNMNHNNEHIVNKKPTNNDPFSVIKDVIETENFELNRQEQKNIDDAMGLLNFNSNNDQYQQYDRKPVNNDDISLVQNAIETGNAESDKRVQKNIYNNMALLNINSNNVQYPQYDKKPTNNEDILLVRNIVEIEKAESNREVQENNNMVNVIDQIFENNVPPSMKKDVIETTNVDLDSEEIERFVAKNINRNKNVVDKNLAGINSRSFVENNLKTNNVEMARKIVQTIFSNVLLKKYGIHDRDNNIFNKSIYIAPTEDDGIPDELKNKAITSIINKRRPLNLSVEHLPVIFIGFETQNVQDGKGLQKDKTTQIRPDENCPYIESEVRIWCQGLHNVIKNLAMGLDWIDNACTNLLQLKQEVNLSACNRKVQEYHNRKWIKLRRNIDSDARLWKKLSTSLQVGLRSYKYYNTQLEVTPI